MAERELTGRVAIVTGAGAGIGAGIAHALAEAGAAVVVNDVDESSAKATAAAIEKEGGRALAVRGDVSESAPVQEMVAETVRRLGSVDILVNNAGIATSDLVENLEEIAWRRVLDVNLTGPFLVSRAFGRLMLAARAGSIVNIASVAGLRGVADRSAYNASKHGLVGLTRTLAAEWGGRGVRVNAVCPGWVKTPMDDESQGEGAYGDADITDHVPLGRFAAPDDVAQAVVFLADTRRSGFVNGTTLSVDGGWYGDGSWQSLRLATRDR